jgi:hypothetical protein
MWRTRCSTECAGGLWRIGLQPRGAQPAAAGSQVARLQEAENGRLGVGGLWTGLRLVRLLVYFKNVTSSL